MKYERATLFIAILGLSTAAPTPKANYLLVPRYALRGREVPQEHSHERFLVGTNLNLKLDNPAGILDAVFGLLGDAAAATGAGTITNLACLHKATADQAFTNAKAAGNVTGQADALLYAALERNTGKVGLASASCTDTFVNPEIQAIDQHQDPASTGAAGINKAIVLELAKQLDSIGADPQLALLSGTFAPGDLNDNTGAGNSCDTQDDPVGCIFTENLIVNDATPEEIDAAVSGSAVAVGGDAAASTTAAAAATSTAAESECASPVVATVTVDAAAATSTVAAAVATASVGAGSASGGTNVQTFTGTLGGPPPPVESSSGDRPFSVNGDTFVNIGAALQRSCAVQHNACANAVNSGSLAASVSDCGTQETACNAAAPAKAKRAALNFGSCSDPSILFEDGLDGRDQAAFIASNEADFNHGSALNIGVIAQFICGQLASSCKASAATIDACKTAQAAAAAVTGQASADAFNSALGV